MNFAQIIFLLGAAAVAGPIVAHLIARPRYRKVPFTMLQFLEAGQREAQARTRLRNLLILLLRCAIIALVAVLFAGPQITRTAEAAKVRHAYYLGIDNSGSMGYSEGGTSLWETAAAKAHEAIKEAPADAVFNINALASGEWGRGLRKGAADLWVASVGTVPLAARTAEFVAEMRSAEMHKSPDTQVTAAIISDFTPAFLDDLRATDAPVKVDEVKVVRAQPEGPVRNAGITRGAVTGGTSTGVELGAGVRSYGSEGVTRTLTARIHDATVASANVEVTPFAERAVTLEVAPTAMPAGETCVPVELVLSGGDGLATDDHFYLAIWQAQRQERTVKIAGSTQRERFLLKTAIEALSAASWFETTHVAELSYADISPETLKGANVLFLAGEPAAVGDKADVIEAFVKEGGRAVFFLSTEVDAGAIEKLWSGGLLAAKPRQFKAGEARIEGASFAAATARGTSVDEETVRALQNYGMDRILLTGYHECETAGDSAVLWRLKNESGFLYVRRLGNGVSFLVNTSADDTLGDLTKSPAAPAFCRLFLGRAAAPESRSFHCGERVTLAAVEEEMQAARAGESVWALDPSGKSVEAATSDGTVSLTGVRQTGWVKTVAKPVRYAGVNLPEGEADMTKGPDQEIAAAVAKTILAAPHEVEQITQAPGGKEYQSIWRLVAWLVAALIVLEAFVANRTQR